MNLYAAGITLLVLILFSIAIYYAIKRDEKEKSENKRYILYNRRTRQLKEVKASEYVERASWEKVATIYDSILEGFIAYLKNYTKINNDGRFDSNPGEYYIKRMLMSYLR